MTEETEKPDIAIALQYDGKNAPRVTAKGEDDIAERIRAIAEEHDIPLHEDAVLAQILSQIELGEEIPRALYVTVAEVIAFSYLLAGRVCAIPEYQSKKDQSGKEPQPSNNTRLPPPDDLC